MRKGFKHGLGSEWQLHALIFPGLLLVLIYSYGPIFGIVIAFQNYIPARGISGSEWTGLENFQYMLAMPNIAQVVWNTLSIATMKIIAGIFVAIITALLLNEMKIKFIKRGIQSLIYLPHFMSWVVLSGVLVDLLSPSSGIVNKFITALGFPSIFFLGDNDWFPFTLVITEVWKEFGFSTIVFLAALTSISPTLYEAAVMDGANRWRQTIYVTLPGILPIIILVATLNLGNVLNAGFEQVFTLYSPSVYASGDIIDTLVYRIGLIDAQFGVGAAIGLMKSIVALVLISIAYYLAYRLANYRIF